MDRINGANTVDIGGGHRGFRAQNVAAGIAGTELAPTWFNDLQEEVLTVIEMAGLVPAAGNWHQLCDAIDMMIASAQLSLNGYVTDASLATSLAAYLLKAGDTLTDGGHISDPNDPTAADHLVRKGYLDARIASISGGSGLPANAAGYLHNDGSGILIWSTPAASMVLPAAWNDVGSVIIGALGNGQLDTVAAGTVFAGTTGTAQVTVPYTHGALVMAPRRTATAEQWYYGVGGGSWRYLGSNYQWGDASYSPMVPYGLFQRIA